VRKIAKLRMSFGRWFKQFILVVSIAPLQVLSTQRRSHGYFSQSYEAPFKFTLVVYWTNTILTMPCLTLLKLVMRPWWCCINAQLG